MVVYCVEVPYEGVIEIHSTFEGAERACKALEEKGLRDVYVQQWKVRG